MKTSNYSKVRFKALIYFEIRTIFELKLRIKAIFELDPSQIYFELVLLQINHVQINHAF